MRAARGVCCVAKNESAWSAIRYFRKPTSWAAGPLEGAAAAARMRYLPPKTDDRQPPTHLHVVALAPRPSAARAPRPSAAPSATDRFLPRCTLLTASLQRDSCRLSAALSMALLSSRAAVACLVCFASLLCESRRSRNAQEVSSHQCRCQRKRRARSQQLTAGVVGRNNTMTQ